MLPMLVAAGTALAALIADLLVPRWRWPWAVALAGAVLTMVAAVVTPTSPFGVFCAELDSDLAHQLNCSYAFDGRARLVAVLTAALTGIALLLFAPALSRAEAPAGEASFLLTAAMTGGVVVGGAGDLVTLIVALETLTLPLYALVALHRRRAGQASAASVTFFLTSVVATALSLLGAALLYLGTGKVYLRAFVAYTEFGDRTWGPVGLVGLILILVGLAFKVAAVPLHAWAPITYDGAPLPIAMFLSTASKLGGVAAILIVVEAALGGAFGRLGPDGTVFTAIGIALAVLAVLSMVVGTLVALRQQRTVRLLAWSSVAQAGFILAPLGGLIGLGATELGGAELGGPERLLDAALAYTLFFLVLEAGAFSAVVALRPAATDGGGLDELRGLGRTAPWRSAALVAALIGLAGLPPVLAGLFAKITVIGALAAVDSYGLALLVALISVVGLAVYWRPLALIYRSAPELEPELAPPPPATAGGVALAAPAVLAQVVVARGILAPPLVALAITTLAGLVLTVAPQLVYAVVSFVR